MFHDDIDYDSDSEIQQPEPEPERVELGVHDPIFDPYTYPEFSNLPIPIVIKVLAQYPRQNVHSHLPDGFKLGLRIIYCGRMNRAIWCKREQLLEEMQKELDELRKKEDDEMKRKLLEPQNLPKYMRYPDDYG